MVAPCNDQIWCSDLPKVKLTKEQRAEHMKAPHSKLATDSFQVSVAVVIDLLKATYSSVTSGLISARFAPSGAMLERHQMCVMLPMYFGMYHGPASH